MLHLFCCFQLSFLLSSSFQRWSPHTASHILRCFYKAMCPLGFAHNKLHQIHYGTPGRIESDELFILTAPADRSFSKGWRLVIRDKRKASFIERWANNGFRTRNHFFICCQNMNCHDACKN